MAHFAKLENGKVTGVYVVHNNELLVDGVEQESKGIEFITQLMGDGTYVQTSYNTYKGVHSGDKEPLRKNYAGIGWSYDAERDAFIPTKPYDSWSLNEDTCRWVPPVPYPEDGQKYEWNEGSQEWL
tara:strand:+ start:1638 stop:2015 length:378 start_codon:yes stop_codon:yes gene_type:complete